MYSQITNFLASKVHLAASIGAVSITPEVMGQASETINTASGSGINATVVIQLVIALVGVFTHIFDAKAKRRALAEAAKSQQIINSQSVSNN